MKNIILLLLIALFAGCKPKYTSNGLGNFIHLNLKNNNNILDLKPYKNNSWNKLYILEPYINKTQFDITLQKYEQEIVQTGIEGLDDRFVLLLFNNEQLVDVSIIKRSINFSDALKYDGFKIGFYAKTDCTFHYKTEDVGWFKIIKP
ncbi:MAG: hypothetical protein EOP42_23985 [Sphingobacteriaceae bacterium]|nr:MAG: hypothetical protein EOP42_23985 [Sphingobacteriaceae bacterium]